MDEILEELIELKDEIFGLNKMTIVLKLKMLITKMENMRIKNEV